MTIELQLPPETEAVVRRRAAAAGLEPAAFVARIVTEQLREAPDSGPPSGADADATRKWWDSWAALHPQTDHFVDDSRESIY